MTTERAYESSPVRARLADHLSALNEALTAEGVPDHIRIVRLRMYAQQFQDFPDMEKFDGEEDELPPGVYAINHRFKAQITIARKVFNLGYFDTPEEAREAFLRAKERAVKDNPTAEAPRAPRPDRPSRSGHRVSRPRRPRAAPSPKPNGLPHGVCRNAGRFGSVIKISGQRYWLGTFGTPEEASQAFKAAHVAHYGELSQYFAELHPA